MSKNTDGVEKEKKPKEKFVVRTPTDIQRIKLQRLMENPVRILLGCIIWHIRCYFGLSMLTKFHLFQNKEVVIPVPRVRKTDEFGNASIPSFVRNVMGSSAGAGSGEFHVYRHLRRKEYARQKHIQQKSKQVSSSQFWCFHQNSLKICSISGRAWRWVRKSPGGEPNEIRVENGQETRQTTEEKEEW